MDVVWFYYLMGFVMDGTERHLMGLESQKPYQARNYIWLWIIAGNDRSPMQLHVSGFLCPFLCPESLTAQQVSIKSLTHQVEFVWRVWVVNICPSNLLPGLYLLSIVLLFLLHLPWLLSDTTHTLGTTSPVGVRHTRTTVCLDDSCYTLPLR